MSQHMFMAPLLWRGAAGLALTLLLAACGPTGGGSTLTPTATPTPVPCTAWQVVSSPTTTMYAQSALSGVSALSPSSAWTVGATYTGGGGPLATLIEQWDGSSWRIVASPGSGYLNSVAAVSSRDVWAVGNAVSGQGVESQVTTLVEHWNGTQWSVVPTSNETASSLTSVAALDANTVWAVGAYSPTAGGSLPLFERWDGTVWRVVAGPALPGVTESILNAVARIPGTNQLWAVGYTLKGPRPAYEQPLIERWDGTVWRVIAGPALPDGAFGVKLHGVVALSATNAWAVGEYTASDHTIRLFIAQWDGATWRSVSIPEAANIAHSALLSVAATGAHDVRAGGYYFSDVNSNSVSQALVMRWNGAAWDVVTLPAPEGVDYTAIGAMTTDGAGGFWAAGNYLHPDTGSTSTLIERCG